MFPLSGFFCWVGKCSFNPPGWPWWVVVGFLFFLSVARCGTIFTLSVGRTLRHRKSLCFFFFLLCPFFFPFSIFRAPCVTLPRSFPVFLLFGRGNPLPFFLVPDFPLLWAGSSFFLLFFSPTDVSFRRF